MVKKQLKIGFDFDGVIAYNPLRILRRPAMWILELVGLKKKKELRYPVPKNFHNRFFWAILHETSFFPAYGLTELADLLRQKKIKAYLITGRYSFLKEALMRWLKFRGIDDVFEKVYLNENDEQPHMYKERIIKKLKLDIFVEDNWDIVEYLNERLNKREMTVQVHWIYNIVDRFKSYQFKYPHIHSFVPYLKSLVSDS